MNDFECSPRLSARGHTIAEARALDLLPHDVDGYVRALGELTSEMSLPRPSFRALGMLKAALKHSVYHYHSRSKLDQSKIVAMQDGRVRKPQPLAVQKELYDGLFYSRMY